MASNIDPAKPFLPDPSISDLQTNFLHAKNEIEWLQANKLTTADLNLPFKGKFTTLIDLIAALPTANAGDYAQVDIGSGSDVANYNWDVEAGWVQGGAGSGATSTDTLIEGSINLYFTASRVRSTLLDALSLASSTVIGSTDSILSALGSLQAQISLRATLLSPSLTGTPTSPTPSAGDSSTRISTTAFVAGAVTDLYDAVILLLAGKQNALTAGPNISLSGATIRAGIQPAWQDSVTGTIPKLIGVLNLKAGTYTPSGYFGCTDPAFSATILIKKIDTTAVGSIGGSAGTLAWRTGSAFTLTADTVVHIFLQASDLSAKAIIKGFEL